MKKLLGIIVLGLLLSSNVALSKDLNLLCKAKNQKTGKTYTQSFNINFNKFQLTDDNNDPHKLYINKRNFISIITKETEGNESLVAIKIYRSSGEADIEIYSLNNDQMDKLWKEVDIYLEAKDFLDSVDLSVEGNNFVTYAVFLALREIFKPQATATFMCEKSTIKF